MSIADIMEAVSIRGRTYSARRVVRACMVGLVCGLAVSAIVLLPPRRWTSRAILLAEGSASGSGGALTALAGQLGVNVGGASAADNPAIYRMMLESADVLESLDSIVLSDEQGRQVNLRAVLNIDEPDSARALGFLTEKLRADVLAMRVDRATSSLEASVTLTDSAMARIVLTRLLTQLEIQNVSRRRFQARREREFLERMLMRQARGLMASRDSLVSFRQRNRSIDVSPELQLRNAALSREIARQEEVESFLRRQLEEARIQEVRDLPTFSTVVGPTSPRLPERRRAALKILAAAFAGTCVYLAWALRRLILDSLQIERNVPRSADGT